jgi:hypothetical protein
MIVQVQNKVRRHYLIFKINSCFPYDILCLGALDAKWDHLICKNSQLQACKNWRLAGRIGAFGWEIGAQPEELALLS